MDTKSIEDCFRLMGLEPGATLAEVKEAYRFLAQTFHVDKYLPNHPFRERALNKMVELNLAYEQLKAFFQENPSGAPAGGWRSTKTEDCYRDDTDSMDWQSWQKDQEDSWNSELNEWHQRENKRRGDLISEADKKRRLMIVRLGRVGLAAAFLCLLVGHSGSHTMRETTNGLMTGMLKDKLQYDLATHGTANGAYIQSNAQIMAQDMPLLQNQYRANRDEASRNGTSSFLLLLTGCALAWVFFSKKAKLSLDNWVEGSSNNLEAAQHA